jgi:hypothetical protein
VYSARLRRDGKASKALNDHESENVNDQPLSFPLLIVDRAD